MAAKQHFLLLDGMRGLAAVIVMGFHITQHNHIPSPRFAQLAVDFFFLLSGFVVAYAYEGRLLTSMSAGRFMLVRMIRLYPMILVGMLMGLSITALRVVLVHDITWLQFLSVSASSLLILPTFALPQYPTAYPANMAMWSLTFEIFANVIYALIVRRLSNVLLIVIIASSIAAMIAIDIDHGTMLYGGAKYLLLGGLPRVGFSFFAGILFFRLSNPEVRTYGNLASYAIALPFCFLLLVFCKAPGWADIVLIILVLPLAFFSASKVRTSGVTTRICIWLGQLSYPLYAVHDPILRAFSTFQTKNAYLRTHLAVLIIAEAGLSVVVALLMLHLYDEPVRKWLSSRLKRSSAHQ